MSGEEESILDRMVRAMSESSTNSTLTGDGDTLDKPPQGIQEQLLIKCGLGDIGIGSDFNPSTFILFRRQGGDENDGEFVVLRLATNSLRQRETIHMRHFHI